MQYPSRKSRQSLHHIDDELDLPIAKSNRFVSQLPMAVAGIMLLVAFVFAGNLIGRNASAHNANPEEVASLVAPTSALASKGSLLPDGQNFSDVNLLTLRRQTVIAEGKGDLDETHAAAIVPAVSPPLPRAKPVNIAHLAAQAKGVKIIPASYNTKADGSDDASTGPAVKRIIVNPAQPNVVAKLDANPQTKLQLIAQSRVRTAELTCLAKAVYFESRSESDLGQLAVAKVILNRVSSPDFPKTICGVVYQGSQNRNSCQFSFACDGLTVDVKSPQAWAHAKMIAERAVANDPAVAMLGTAVNYHADYVSPRWSHVMRRLIRIGHHIFYAQRGNG